MYLLNFIMPNKIAFIGLTLLAKVSYKTISVLICLELLTVSRICTYDSINWVAYHVSRHTEFCWNAFYSNLSLPKTKCINTRIDFLECLHNMWYWERSVQHAYDLSMGLILQHEPSNRNVWKCTFEYMRPVKIQIRTSWSQSSLHTFWILKDSNFFMRAMKSLIRARGWVGWFESLLNAHVITKTRLFKYIEDFTSKN